MHDSIQKLNLVKNKVNEIITQKQLKTNPQIIVVSKTFPLSVVTPLIDSGHMHYGENKIQEAENKCTTVLPPPPTCPRKVVVSLFQFISACMDLF